MADRSIEDLQRDQFLAEAESLAQLVGHPAWPRYETLLTQMREGVLELLATARSPRLLSRYQGAAAILAELIDRPHRIVATGHAVLAEETERKAEVRTALDLAERVDLVDDI